MMYGPLFRGFMYSCTSLLQTQCCQLYVGLQVAAQAKRTGSTYIILSILILDMRLISPSTDTFDVGKVLNDTLELKISSQRRQPETET